jgi:ribosomal protein S18 acetylase RimI-like enzyme
MPLIRLAIRHDAKQLAGLQEQTFRDTFEALNTPADMAQHCATHYSTALQEQEILNPDMITLVCEDQEILIGFTQLRFKNSPVDDNAQRAAEIQRLYVEKNWHGKGIAQQLMTEAITSVRRLGADQIWLGVWEKNPRAISFYRKFDFVEIGEHIFILGSDAQRDIILRKNLEGHGDQEHRL